MAMASSTTSAVDDSALSLGSRVYDVVSRTFDLGVTGFGGPAVHFQIFHRRYVDENNGKVPWIDEQTYQELFSISQALPGPGSTKMLFSIAFLRAGFLPALFVFLLWSLPGALGMYGLSLGVERVDQVLPGPVYALLSGLNASTVGIIALAAVQLARKAITDPLTRLLVLFGACAGLCYNALWYFPVIMVVGGLITVLWDHWLRAATGRWMRKAQKLRGGHHSRRSSGAEESGDIQAIPIDTIPSSASVNTPSTTASRRNVPHDRQPTEPVPSKGEELQTSRTVVNELTAHQIPVKVGLVIIVGFFAIFTTLMVLRGTLDSSPLELQLFISMFLAGTVIFGGGPVVIPLLRAYVVEPGWVTARDFLIGLAIIQAFPGPNFNFAVYLGALAVNSSSSGDRNINAAHMLLGAVLGFLGIFFPGLTLALGFQSLWRALRSNRFVTSLLRGVNASAVGLVFTAVHRLWEIGYLKPDATQGVSLGSDPWWVVISAVTYVSVESFGVPTTVGIIGGGVLGLTWYGAVGR